MAHHRYFPRSIHVSETLEAWILVAGIVIAYFFVASDAISVIVEHTRNFNILGSFIEGFFFTSMLTTVPAIVGIIESSSFVPLWQLALFGGIGAVCGDLLLFRFVRSRLIERILRAMFDPKLVTLGRKLGKGPLWWVPVIGGMLIIVSPLPDEIGLVMLGMSHLSLMRFVPLSFAANAGGIYLIALAAQRLG